MNEASQSKLAGEDEELAEGHLDRAVGSELGERGGGELSWTSSDVSFGQISGLDEHPFPTFGEVESFPSGDGPPLAPVVVVASFIWTGLLDYSAFELDFLWKVLAWSKVESLTSIATESVHQTAEVGRSQSNHNRSIVVLKNWGINGIFYERIWI